MSEWPQPVFANKPFPIFVINLNRHPERMESMVKRLDSLNLEFERFPGIDGKELGKDFKSAAACCAELRIGEIGCFESHRRIWQRIAEMDTAGAFVLEDDIVLASDFATWEFPSHVLEKAHLIKLDTAVLSRAEYGSSSVRLGRGRVLVRLLGNEYSTGCYFVTKRGAFELLRASEQYILPVDRFMFDRVSKVFWKMKIWKMDPSAAIQARFLPRSGGLDIGLSDSISSNRTTLEAEPQSRFGMRRWGTVFRKLRRGEFEVAGKVRTIVALRQFRINGRIYRRSIPFADIPPAPPHAD